MSTTVQAAGPLDVVVGHCAPANCMDCPESSVIPDPDPDDWFCDDDCAVVCRKTPNEKRNTTSRHAAEQSQYRAVTVACRPYNRRREADRPEWCPMVPNVEAQGREPAQQAKRPSGAQC